MKVQVSLTRVMVVVSWMRSTQQRKYICCQIPLNGVIKSAYSLYMSDFNQLAKILSSAKGRSQSREVWIPLLSMFQQRL
jgi:hypothetical protein